MFCHFIDVIGLARSVFFVTLEDKKENIQIKQENLHLYITIDHGNLRLTRKTKLKQTIKITIKSNHAAGD